MKGIEIMKQISFEEKIGEDVKRQILKTPKSEFSERSLDELERREAKIERDFVTGVIVDSNFFLYNSKMVKLWVM